MPTNTSLAVTPSSARALAAARPGEEVVVRVAMEEQPPEYIVRWELLDDVGPAYWCGIDENGDWQVSRTPPAAVGERVALLVQAEHQRMEAINPLTGSPFSFEVTACDTLPATVTAAPEPEAVECPERQSYGTVPEWFGRTRATCPTCHGTPSEHVWRVGVRREAE